MAALPQPRRAIEESAPSRAPARPEFERLRQRPDAPPAPAAWTFATFAGRLGELRGGQASAALSLAFRLVLDAQRAGETVAWITRRDRAFYPPDVAQAAVDVEALVVIWAADSLASARAADQLARSGGFGLVVLDLGADARLPTPIQARLAGLARKHGAAVLCLTEKKGRQPYIRGLISIRAEALRSGRENDRFRCRASVLKDKRRGSSWEHEEMFDGPDGLH